MEKIIFDDTILSEIELLDVEYASYMATFGKSYSSKDEYKMRKEIYKDHRNLILNQFNKDEIMTGLLFGLNQMSDLTEEEYLGALGAMSIGAMPKVPGEGDPTVLDMYDVEDSQKNSWMPKIINLSPKPASENKDTLNSRTNFENTNVSWLDVNGPKVVSSVKNQGKCAAGHVFATVAALESF